MPAVKRLALKSKVRPSVFTSNALLAVVATNAAILIEFEMLLHVHIHRPLNNRFREVAVRMHVVLLVLLEQCSVGLEVRGILVAVLSVLSGVLPKPSLKVVQEDLLDRS